MHVAAAAASHARCAQRRSRRANRVAKATHPGRSRALRTACTRRRGTDHKQYRPHPSPSSWQCTRSRPWRDRTSPAMTSPRAQRRRASTGRCRPRRTATPRAPRRRPPGATSPCTTPRCHQTRNPQRHGPWAAWRGRNGTLPKAATLSARAPGMQRNHLRARPPSRGACRPRHPGALAGSRKASVHPRGPPPRLPSEVCCLPP
mmetsp:Transcript_114652/g.358534  ORF Transcript_114652/g.358534 Transcript_114652/m.358534 type:complete len:203 (+) Transcript_114652:528-1136(+)